jgi:hypothetical protein
VNDGQRKAVREALARYLQGTDPLQASFRQLAREHGLLPILPDWSGFVGLREDGELFYVSDEDGTANSATLNEHARHIALIRGPEMFPELAFLRPVVAANWIECRSCDGSGVVTYDGQPLPAAVRCACGGLGRLSPALARVP